MVLKHLLLSLALCIFCTNSTATPKKTAKVKPNTSNSVWLYNVTDNAVEYDRNSLQVRPMASITKIMTAMVALDHDKNLERKLPISKRVGGYLPNGSYSRRELLMAMLVKSDNAAAETLAEAHDRGREGFIADMNQLAREWGLTNMQFADPTGLSAANVATAREIGEMLIAASGYWFIREVSVKKQIAIDTYYKNRIRTVNLNNTNTPILFEFDNIVVSKTGLTSRAGFCLALVVEQGGRQYTAVFLGDATKQQRTDKVKRVLYNHVIDANLPPLNAANN